MAMTTRNDDTSPDVAKKTKGKRSKLNQRRPSFRRTPLGPEFPLTANGTSTRREAAPDLPEPRRTHIRSNIFGSGDIGDMGNESDLDGGLMQQGSPTLLSALKGSSLRASAYGQDFTTSSKEDDMSLLGSSRTQLRAFTAKPAR